MMQDNNYMINDLAAQASREFYPDHVVSCTQQDADFLFTCANGVRLSLQVITDKILRFRYATDGLFAPDFSYALPPDQTRRAPEFLEFREKADHYRITTDRLICTLAKENLHARILNRSGTVLCEDEKGFHWQYNDDTGNDLVLMSKQVQSGVCYYGLGDKPANMNLRGQRFTNWDTDTYGYVKGSDPLYKNVPFYLELQQKTASKPRAVSPSPARLRACC